VATNPASLLKKAVFFDLGGTLLVMRRDRIFRKVMEEEGRDVPVERIHSAYLEEEQWWLTHYGTHTMSPEQTTEAYRHLDQRVFSVLFPEEPETESFRISRLVRKRWPELEKDIPLALYPDAEPTLSRLRGEGFSMGLISNAPADTLRAVEALGLKAYLDHIVISGSVGYTKPHPEIFRIALKLAGVESKEAVHVGDLYEADVVGARNAGIEGILLDREGSHIGPPCLRIKSLSEIHAYLA